MDGRVLTTEFRIHHSEDDLLLSATPHCATTFHDHARIIEGFEPTTYSFDQKGKNDEDPLPSRLSCHSLVGSESPLFVPT